MFGNPETTSGGLALKFYASVRLDVRRIETLKQGGDTVGSRTRVSVKKNKVAPPFRQAEFDILYNQGISKEGDLLDLGANMNIIEKRGAFYSFDGTRLGQGRENAREFLINSPQVAAQIEAAIRSTAAAAAPEADIPMTSPDVEEDAEEY
jgi:recombination protein RecA